MIRTKLSLREKIFSVLTLTGILYVVAMILIGRASNVDELQSLPLPKYHINNSSEASLDNIRFVQLQIEAVTVDMYRYLGWFPEEKKMLTKASIKATNDLKMIKDYLRPLSFTGQSVELKQISLEIADRLIKLYTSIDSKDEQQNKKAFVEFNKFYSQYSEKLAAALAKYEPTKNLPEDFDTTQEDIKCGQNQQDKQIYLSAVELIKRKQFGQAYTVLTKLKEKYKGTAFESCIKLRMSDCLLMAEPNEQGENEFDPEKGIVLLSDILDGREYSPVLFTAFYKWRTQSQAYWYGMSNMSEIPNWQYNLKRWQAVQTIRQYLNTNPKDDWANIQVGLLLNLPNIERGGPFGNDNISQVGALYLNYSSNGEKTAAQQP